MSRRATVLVTTAAAISLVLVSLAPVLAGREELGAGSPQADAVGGAASGEQLFLLTWGSEGRGDGQFGIAEGVAVHGTDSIYVADGRVQKFDSNGNFITKWGSFGTGEGQFKGTSGLAVDGAGDVWVVDQGNARVQKFDSNGNFILEWGSLGFGDGEFDFEEDS